MTSELDLGAQALDKAIVTRDGRSAGKVDDLILEVDPTDPSQPPRVSAILTGPTALSSYWGPLAGMVRFLYRLIGVPATSVEIPWERVDRIETVVRLDILADEYGLDVLHYRMDDLIIDHIPGA